MLAAAVEDERSFIVVSGATFKLCSPPWKWRSSQREGGRMDTVWRAPHTGARIRSKIELARYIAENFRQLRDTLQRVAGDEERSIKSWIVAALGEMPPGLDAGLGPALQSGVVLCKIANLLVPDSVSTISQENVAQNFAAYTAVCRKAGIPDAALLCGPDDCSQQDKICQHFRVLGDVFCEKQRQSGTTDPDDVEAERLLMLAQGQYFDEQEAAADRDEGDCTAADEDDEDDEDEDFEPMIVDSEALRLPLVRAAMAASAKKCAGCGELAVGRLGAHAILDGRVGQFEVLIQLRHPEHLSLCSRCYQRNWRIARQQQSSQAEEPAAATANSSAEKPIYLCICGRGFTTPQLKAAHCRSCAVYRTANGLQQSLDSPIPRVARPPPTVQPTTTTTPAASTRKAPKKIDATAPTLELRMCVASLAHVCALQHLLPPEKATELSTLLVGQQSQQQLAKIGSDLLELAAQALAPQLQPPALTPARL